MKPILYENTLEEIKNEIFQARNRALQVVNTELVELYRKIGKIISEKCEEEKWGDSTVKQLSKDLDISFPGIRGFSTRNLWRMKDFYEAYKENEKVTTLSAQIGWSQNVALLRLKSDEEKVFYMQMTEKYGWSVRMLERQIESDLFKNAKNNQENFFKTLDKQQAVLAKDNLKDDYNFDFLDIREKHSERELEEALIMKICDFLKELGGSYSFIDRQYRVEVSGDEYFVDLLFYNREMQCLVAIDLKVGEFKPEYASKMNFYLSALDENVKLPHEKNSIGIIICRSKDETKVEYSLKGMGQPLGVSTYTHYKTLKDLPEEVSRYLPEEEEMVKRLGQE
jgi:predicted nuclease of restriction endonuclease-like (RecB) superfamily